MTSSRVRRMLLGFSALLLFALQGCSGVVEGPQGAPSPPTATPLLPAGALEGRMVLQQHVSVRWSRGERGEGGEESFDAVLQKHADQLLLLGLGPMSQVAFSLTLEDRQVEFENRSGREMPFQPEHLLADVQRIFYPWLVDVPPCVECERRGRRVGLDVHERIGAERIEERRFTIAAAPGRGQVVVRYLEWAADGRTPSRVTLENGWFGYSLIIESVRAEPEPDPE